MNSSERILISMNKLLEVNEEDLKIYIFDIEITVVEGMEDNKIEITRVIIQKTNQEKDLQMGQL